MMTGYTSDKDILLIVDDDPSVCQYVSRVCRRVGFESIVAANPTAAVASLSNSRLLGVITDLQMPRCDGIEFLRLLAEGRTDLPVVIHSGLDPRVLNIAQRFGGCIGLNIVGKLRKPVSVAALEATLAKISGRASSGQRELASGSGNQ